MDDDRLTRLAVDSFRAGVAVLDAEGRIVWTNAAWLRNARQPDDVFAGAGPGANVVSALQANGDVGVAISGGIAAVVAGRSAYFELEAESRPGTSARTLVTVTPFATARGATILRTDLSPLLPRRFTREARPVSPEVGAMIARLTPREHEVLALMVRGLDNRAIAAELGIEYTTVRGYARTLIEKLGARSRLEAVSRAYRTGLVER